MHVNHQPAGFRSDCCAADANVKLARLMGILEAPALMAHMAELRPHT